MLPYLSDEWKKCNAYGCSAYLGKCICIWLACALDVDVFMNDASVVRKLKSGSVGLVSSKWLYVYIYETDSCIYIYIGIYMEPNRKHRIVPNVHVYTQKRYRTHIQTEYWNKNNREEEFSALYVWNDISHFALSEFLVYTFLSVNQTKNSNIFNCKHGFSSHVSWKFNVIYRVVQRFNEVSDRIVITMPEKQKI